MKKTFLALLGIVLLTGFPSPAPAVETTEIPLVAHLRERALPLATEADLDPLLARAHGARLILLGDGSHGSYDFYRVRAHISQRLIAEQDIAFIAVEGDWASTAEVDRYVRHLPGAAASAAEALRAFNRWPDWVWKNSEFERLVEWLHRFNGERPPERRVALYGMDLLGFPDSLQKLIDHPATTEAGSSFRQCLAPYLDNPLTYPVALAQGATDCTPELAALRARVAASDDHDGDLAAQLHVVENAEAYYRAMATSSASAWNRRVAHFAETLERLLDRHGPAARGLVWAHNTHVGDARLSAMAGQGMQSLGELLRTRFGTESTLLVGSATYTGSVLSGRDWGAPVATLPVPPAMEGSFEDLMHRAGHAVAYWLFAPGDRHDGPLAAPCGLRAIGVVYQPEFDARDNYLATILPGRFDAFIFIDRTRALEIPPSPSEKERP
ncbi:erythromycin esterase family protein [Desulfuromonas acetexigens]|jgi:erythromycin esterase-like protein|uniref:Erythromycin esterase family protein n=1 Tax=Trichloromonas acetexigens TaxID=38815 RepID=A0A550J6B8_9BACT|nr:erythromycin esterase family protein [Desulfuromonas acetexigens]TRO78796.1 erythromycin esterase family protein [Desulfuromonas acetexigens]